MRSPNFRRIPIAACCRSRIIKNKSRTFVRLCLVMRFIRLHPGVKKCGATNSGSLSKPRHQQNLYATPHKRTAKQIPALNLPSLHLQYVGKSQIFQNIFKKNANTRISVIFWQVLTFFFLRADAYGVDPRAGIAGIAGVVRRLTGSKPLKKGEPAQTQRHRGETGAGHHKGSADRSAKLCVPPRFRRLDVKVKSGFNCIDSA